MCVDPKSSLSISLLQAAYTGLRSAIQFLLTIMHDRCRTTTDPDTLTVPARSMSGFHRPDAQRLREALSAVSCLLGESTREGELYFY